MEFWFHGLFRESQYTDLYFELYGVFGISLFPVRNHSHDQCLAVLHADRREYLRGLESVVLLLSGGYIALAVLFGCKPRIPSGTYFGSSSRSLKNLARYQYRYFGQRGLDEYKAEPEAF